MIELALVLLVLFCLGPIVVDLIKLAVALPVLAILWIIIKLIELGEEAE